MVQATEEGRWHAVRNSTAAMCTVAGFLCLCTCRPRRKLTRKITCSFGAGDLNHQQAADRQVSELIHGPAHSLQPAVDDDLFDHLNDPSVETVKSDTTQTMILSDGSLTTFAVPADDEDPDEVCPCFLL